MEKMPKPAQRKMLKALNKAADYSKEGMSPDEALTKVASEYELNAPMVERVCEAYNKANAIAYMNSAPENKRADNYPIAKIANVISNIFGTHEKKASEISFKKKDYASLGFVAQSDTPMTKVAGEKKTHNPIHRKSVARSLDIIKGQMEKISKRVSDDKMKAERAVTNGIDAFTAAISKVPANTRVGKNELHKIAQNLADALGEENAHIIINAANANGGDPVRYMECLPKRAHATILPSKPIYKIAKKLIDDRDNMIEMQKAANDEVLDMFSPLSDTVGSLPALSSAPDKVHMDLSTGMTGEWDAYAKDLNSRRMLYDMMLNDEEISAYSPRKVQTAYNDIVETFPELSKQSKILRAILRKSLAQGGNMDIYEIKDLISAGKEKSSSDKEGVMGRSALNESINSGGAGNNSNKTQSVEIKVGPGK